MEQLGWLVGEWESSSPDQTTELSCKWTEDRHYLLVDVRTCHQGTAEQFSNERIAWDPAEKNIRSWIFRSDGSFGESVWSEQGRGWQARTRGVATSGEPIRGTVHWVPLEDGRMSLRSEGVKVGNQNVPDVEIILTRTGNPFAPMPPAESPAVENIVWEMFEMNGVPMEFDRPLSIRLADGKVDAAGPVNRIGGSYTLTGNSLKFSRLMATAMAGPPELMQLESAFTQLLESIDTLQLEGQDLLLQDGTQTAARFRRGR